MLYFGNFFHKSYRLWPIDGGDGHVVLLVSIESADIFLQLHIVHILPLPVHKYCIISDVVHSGDWCLSTPENEASEREKREQH